LIKTTSYQDRQDITWIFLNTTGEDEKFLKYLEEEEFDFNSESVERDSNAIIIWSMLDGDLIEEERSQSLLGWVA
jgi:hypothetical protein